MARPKGQVRVPKGTEHVLCFQFKGIIADEVAILTDKIRVGHLRFIDLTVIFPLDAEKRDLNGIAVIFIVCLFFERIGVDLERILIGFV